MEVVIVVAVADGNVIGLKGGLPWRLPADLARFRRLTMGHTVVMGRRTWESLPARPLPGRRCIVVTRDSGYAAEGAEVACGLERAIAMARNSGARKVCVIGGGEIYAQAMDLADRIEMTRVLGGFEGDAFFFGG